MAKNKKMLSPQKTIVRCPTNSINFRQIFLFLPVFLITLLLLKGCADPHLPEPRNSTEAPDLDEPKVRNRIFDEAIDETDLQFQRNAAGEKVQHPPNREQPYTGWVKSIRELQQFQNGKKHGIYITWYGNWQKAEQGQYKNGIRDGLWTQWDPKGQKESEGTYEDGGRDGLWTLWHPDGEKESEITYENGRILTFESMSQVESDNANFDEKSEYTGPLAFIRRNLSQGKAQLGGPEGAKRRLGKGKVTDFEYSPDGTRFAVATTVGIWIYDGHTGEELGVPGYTDLVRSIAFSPDGKTLAGASNDIYLWDARTGKQKRILTGTGATVTRVLFSPDEQTLASVSVNPSVDLWDPYTGEHRLRLVGDNISFTPDGASLVIVSGNDLLFWDTLTGEHQHTLTGHSSDDQSILFSPDGASLVSRKRDGTVSLLNLRTGEEKNIPPVLQDNSVRGVSFSPDGKILATGNRDGTISLWDTHTLQQKQTLSRHKHWVSCVSFAPNGEILASGSGDGTVYLWDLQTGQQKRVFTGDMVGYQKAHQNAKEITRLSFNPDGTTLVSECADATVRLWNVDTGQHKNISAGDSTAEIYSLSLSPDSAMIASGSNDGIIRLWNTRTGQRERMLTEHASIVSALSFAPDGAILASGAWDNTIRLWDPHTGQQHDILKGHTNAIVSLSYSPDGETLASGDSKGDIHLWDVRTRQQKNLLKGHTSHVYSVAFSPDGRTLASGEQEKIIYLWDVHTGERKKTITDHTHYVSAVLFSPDGKTLISGSWDDTIRLWDAHTGEQKKNFVWDTISCLAISPDGKTLAGGSVFARGSATNAIRLWDIETGQEKKTFMGHTNSIPDVLFSRDGTMLVSASRDGTILLWDLTATTNAADAAE